LLDKKFGDAYDERVAPTGTGTPLRKFAEPSHPGEGRRLRLAVLVLGVAGALLVLCVALLLLVQGERKALLLVAGAAAYLAACPAYVRMMRRRGRW
jgi:hypothetical protein